LKRYHALMKKDRPAVMAQFVQQSTLALSKVNIKPFRVNDGPLASVAFESDLPLEKLRELLKDQASLVTEITTMSIPKPPPERRFRFLGKRYGITTATSLPAMGFDKIWADKEFNGGSNLSILSIDTGVDEEYYNNKIPPYVADRYFAGRVLEVFKARPWTGKCHGHGRITLSVIAKAIHQYEDQTWRGALPLIKIYVAQVLDSQGYGDSDTVHLGLVWGLQKKPTAITMSLGGGHDPMLDEDVQRCWDEGIPVIVAAGNSGHHPPDCDGSLNCPADAPNAIACGASNAGHVPEGAQETIQPWSSASQKPDGTKQPWFFAGAGVNINVELGEPVVSGTSLSAPHNAAVVLTTILMLMLRKPSWTAQQLAAKCREILKATALNLGYLGSPNHTPEGAYCLQGHGRLQGDLAWDMAKKEGPEPPPPSKIDKVEFYVDNVKIGETTTGTNDVFQYDKVIDVGDHLFQGEAYSEGLDPVKTESIHFKVVKSTPTKKIVAKATNPTDNQEFQEGATISFKVEAKVVEA